MPKTMPAAIWALGAALATLSCGQAGSSAREAAGDAGPVAVDAWADADPGAVDARPPAPDASSDVGPAASDLAVDATPVADAAELGTDAKAPSSPLAPGLFDCTATGLPERVSTTPVACLTDPACRSPQVAGHRGCGGPLGVIAPEDSLAAYRAAIVLGVDYVETDPRPTVDGVLVNMHDTTVDRTTTGEGSVAEMTFEAVRALTLRSARFAGDFSCERVPTLVEILQTCRGRAMVLVDANKTDRVDLLVQAIIEADALEWAIFDTSSLEKLDAALALEPRLHIMPRPDNAEQLNAALDHFAPRVPEIIEIPADRVVELAAIAAARGARVFTDVFGADVVAGQLGRSERYLEYYDQGAAILQTDRPDLVLRALEAAGRR